MTNGVIWLAAVSVAVAAWGCKKQDDTTPRRAEADAAVRMVAPEKSAPAEASQPGEDFAVEAKSGVAKPRLVLRLDYFPTPSPGRSTLPACFPPFDGQFELGLVVCESTGQVVPLRAEAIDQECYTDSRAEGSAASKPILLPGCQRAKVVTHGFDPPLLVHAEAR